ncbi:hypothetical protein [Nocardioides sp. LHG3406-4]|uniref:hypothetical protein n=1 Tax=Nocardioides sp. LHG3406-4 TaxID=2804575 RepID=UPI003CF2DC27
MTFAPIDLGRFRCDPAPAPAYAAELRALGRAVRRAEVAYATGFGLDRRRFDGAAGDSFRARCRSLLDAATEVSGNLASLSEAAEELSLDAQRLDGLVDETMRLARTGGLVVAADTIHPPDAESRFEDTPALVQGWRAWDAVTQRHIEVETTYGRILDDWIRALGRFGYSAWARDRVLQGPDDVLPPPAAPPVIGPRPPGDAPRLDEESRAWWVEGHRGWDGEWVHAHWRPLGPEGHLPVVLADRGPHVGEHPSGATTARWVGGRWQPVVPERLPPSIA